MRDPQSKAINFFELSNRVGTWWLRSTFHFQMIFVCTFFFLKNGIVTESDNVKNVYLPSALALPDATSYWSASVGNQIIARIFQIENVTSWIFLHSVLIIMAIISCALYVKSEKEIPRGFLLLVLASLPASVTLVATVGKYDVLTYIGAFLISIPEGRLLPLVGVLIMALGNPEQTIMAMICLIVLSSIPKFEPLKETAIWGLAIAMTWYTLIQIWMISTGVVGNRITMLPLFLTTSISNFMVSPLSSIWSWYGVLWLVIILIFVNSKRQTRIRIFLSVVAIPGFCTLVTADGARVFSLIVAPAILSVIRVWNRSETSRTVLTSPPTVGLLLISWLVIPSSSSGGLLMEKAGNFLASLAGSLSLVTLEIGRWFETIIY